MSSQKGNIQRTRKQKHSNKSAFVNTLHDTSLKTKMINTLDVSGVCLTCKGVIEWKIKYKKYKPLTVPKKCTKCDSKSIRFAYHTVCETCAKKHEVCAKCGISDKEIISPKPSPSELTKQESEYRQKLKSLTERQRRTLARNPDDPSKLESILNSADGNRLNKDFSFSDLEDDSEIESEGDES